MPDATFDSQCYALADAFMNDDDAAWCKEDREELAALIQKTIEDYMAAAKESHA
jgi:hypothetical protein